MRQIIDEGANTVAAILDIVVATCTVFEGDFEDADFSEWTSCAGCT